jgi:hypothetical protein
MVLWEKQKKKKNYWGKRKNWESRSHGTKSRFLIGWGKNIKGEREEFPRGTIKLLRVMSIFILLVMVIFSWVCNVCACMYYDVYVYTPRYTYTYMSKHWIVSCKYVNLFNVNCILIWPFKCSNYLFLVQCIESQLISMYQVRIHGYCTHAKLLLF